MAGTGVQEDGLALAPLALGVRYGDRLQLRAGVLESLRITGAFGVPHLRWGEKLGLDSAPTFTMMPETHNHQGGTVVLGKEALCLAKFPSEVPCGPGTPGWLRPTHTDTHT